MNLKNIDYDNATTVLGMTMAVTEIIETHGSKGGIVLAVCFGLLGWLSNKKGKV